MTTSDINGALVRRRPLPQPTDDGKEGRGRLLVVAGSAELPGAALLAAGAGLRAGAGKVMLAAPGESVMALGVALPEARVTALPARPNGRLFDERDAVVVGPGMESKEARRWADAALGLDADVPVLLDATALEKLWTSARLRRRRQDGARSCIVTPHAGELAAMAKLDKDAITGEPARVAAEAAAHLGAIVVLKAGPTTIVATNDAVFRQHARVPGLATSGAGDVLAGLIGGLLARGTAPIDACLWGVFLHAEAGRQLGARSGSIGYRAGELSAEIPLLMDAMR
jgi:hydroxyethylthiazole kinase-like uncharacterized protein yjeF